MSEKKKSTIMVTLTAAALAMAGGAPAMAQLAISCPVVFRIGKLVKCSMGRAVVDPNGNVKSITGCGQITNTPTPGQCVIQTLSAVTKNVRIDFENPTATISRAGDMINLDKLRMTYPGMTNPTTAITITPLQAAAGVTVNIGARLSFSSSLSLGTYNGGIIVRANTL
jgi:hypothetical protein